MFLMKASESSMISLRYAALQEAVTPLAALYGMCQGTMEPLSFDATILIVEDFPAHADLLADVLQGAGYHPRVALTGEQVVAQISEFQHVDLILLDIMLPGIDGFEVCRALKQHEATWDIPVLFITALDDSDSKVCAFKMGGLDFITKPFGREEILARVHNYVRLRKLQQHYLRQLERFRLLSQAAFEGILLVCERNLIEMNDVALQLFGYAWPELANQPVTRVLPDLERISPPLQNESERPTESVGIKKNGNLFPLEIRTRTIPHHQNQAHILAVRDLTWRKQAEQELRRYRDGLEQLVGQRTRELVQANTSLKATILERRQTEEALQISQRQYRQLAEQIDEGIGILRNDEVVFVNPALQAMLPGLRRPAADRCPRTCRSEFETCLQRYKAGQSDETWRMTCPADQRTRYLEGRFSPITWEGEEALLITVRDVTAATQKELALMSEQAHLKRENRALKSLVTQRERFGELVGKSVAMQRVYDAILKSAGTDVTVSIWGESGTGKELAARMIHQHSARQQYPFMPVNCSAIPESLFESELFGHCKGAFTNAHRDKPGIFDVTQHGTLFLDEINSLPVSMQVKLLRVLEGHAYLPVGGQTLKPMNARIIVAGNEDFAQLVSGGHMRLDFFYRIAVMTIALPPLREHKEDLPLLVRNMLEQYRQHGQIPALPNAVLDALMQHDWPGNVRELQNVVHRYLTSGNLSFAQLKSPRANQVDEQMSFAGGEVNGQGLQQAVSQFERRLIRHALTANAGHKGHTAAYLRVDPKTLYRKIKQYGLA